MRKLTLVPPDATANPVYLTAAAIDCIGIVLIVMMTGRLMHHKGVWRVLSCPWFYIGRTVATQLQGAVCATPAQWQARA
jgi:hypothetical protein